jgi:hypothetical protein
MAPKPLKIFVVGIETLILSTMSQTWLEIVEKIVSHCCFVNNKTQRGRVWAGRGRHGSKATFLALRGASWYFQFAKDRATPVSWRVGSSGLATVELNLL